MSIPPITLSSVTLSSVPAASSSSSSRTSSTSGSYPRPPSLPPSATATSPRKATHVRHELAPIPSSTAAASPRRATHVRHELAPVPEEQVPHLGSRSSSDPSSTLALELLNCQNEIERLQADIKLLKDAHHRISVRYTRLERAYRREVLKKNEATEKINQLTQENEALKAQLRSLTAPPPATVTAPPPVTPRQTTRRLGSFAAGAATPLTSRPTPVPPLTRSPKT